MRRKKVNLGEYVKEISKENEKNRDPKKNHYTKSLKIKNKARQKAIKRAKAIVSRAKRAGYVPAVEIDYSLLTTAEIQKITRTRLVDTYGFHYDETKDTILKRKKEKQALKNINKHFKRPKKYKRKTETKTPSNFDRNKTQHPKILKKSDESIQLDLIEKMIQKFSNYRGEFSKKENSVGYILVQNSANRILDIIQDARRKRDDQEIVSNIEAKYGSTDRLADLIEHLILAVYDDVYATWANGKSQYEEAITAISLVVGGEDLGF